MLRRMRAAVALAVWLTLTTSVVAQPPFEIAPPLQSSAPGMLPDVSGAVPLVAPPVVESPVVESPPQPVQQVVALTPADAANAPSRMPLRAPGVAAETRSSGGLGIGSMLLALAVVVGLFLGVAALLRRGMPNQARVLPAEAVEILGRLSLPGRQQGHLIRVGNKIALISFGTGLAEPLVEITDPVEVDRLAGLCRRNDPHGPTASFRGIVETFFREKPGDDARRRPEEDVDD